jgi:hypothetical protein
MAFGLSADFIRGFLARSEGFEPPTIGIEKGGAAKRFRCSFMGLNTCHDLLRGFLRGSAGLALDRAAGDALAEKADQVAIAAPITPGLDRDLARGALAAACSAAGQMPVKARAVAERAAGFACALAGVATCVAVAHGAGLSWGFSELRARRRRQPPTKQSRGAVHRE